MNFALQALSAARSVAVWYRGGVQRVIEVPEVGAGATREADALTPPGEGVLLWIDVEAPSREALEALRVPFGLHPLAIEDCLTFDQRPKVEEFPNHLFVVIHELNLRQGELGSDEIHAFLSDKFLITVREQPCRRIEDVVNRVVGASDLYPRGVAFIYYLLASSVASHNLVTLDELSEAIDEIEEHALNVANGDTLPRFFELKRSLGAARRALSPQRDLFAVLSRSESRWIKNRTALYFRDVYDVLARASETLDSQRELLGNVLDAHFSVVSQRTNEIVKRLTILSAVFLPLTFVTGFFGQNFDHLPFHSALFMWCALLACVLIPLTMLLWFHRRRWL